MAIKGTTITACNECGSNDLFWFTSTRNTGQALDGRLRMHDVACDFVLGCNYCSAALVVVSADQVAAELTKSQGQPAALTVVGPPITNTTTRGETWQNEDN